jgi:hypothetical protein
MADKTDPLIQRLDAIVERLDMLLICLVPPLADPKGELGKVESAILGFCDMQHTCEDIAARIGKSKHHVEVTVSTLRKKGMVRNVKTNGRLVYLRSPVRSSG